MRWIGGIFNIHQNCHHHLHNRHHHCHHNHHHHQHHQNIHHHDEDVMVSPLVARSITACRAALVLIERKQFHFFIFSSRVFALLIFFFHFFLSEKRDSAVFLLLFFAPLLYQNLFNFLFSLFSGLG